MKNDDSNLPENQQLLLCDNVLLDNLTLKEKSIMCNLKEFESNVRSIISLPKIINLRRITCRTAICLLTSITHLGDSTYAPSNTMSIDTGTALMFEAITLTQTVVKIYDLGYVCTLNTTKTLLSVVSNIISIIKIAKEQSPKEIKPEDLIFLEEIQLCATHKMRQHIVHLYDWHNNYYSCKLISKIIIIDHTKELHINNYNEQQNIFKCPREALRKLKNYEQLQQKKLKDIMQHKKVERKQLYKQNQQYLKMQKQP